MAANKSEAVTQQIAVNNNHKIDNNAMTFAVRKQKINIINLPVAIRCF